MMISVIVPGYNVQATVGACLEALLDQTIPRNEYEVIFVDDASSDGTTEIVRRYPDVRLLTLPENRGQANARNVGLEEARGDIILFTDADCVPARNWIEAMRKPFADPDIAGAKGIYRTEQRGLVARFAQLEYESRYGIMRRKRYIDFVDTYSAGYRREALAQHGGFDARFRIDEDQELSFRMAEAGLKMVFNPEAVVYHHHPSTLWRYLKRKYLIGYWKAFVLNRHPEKAVSDSHTPQLLKVQLALAFAALGGGIVSLLYRPLALPAVLALACFVATTMPFALRAAQRDRALGLASPFILFLRALALGLGLAVGVVQIALEGGQPAGE